MSQSKQEMEITYKLGAISAEQAWMAMYEVLQKHGFLEKKFFLYEHKVKPEKMEKAISDSGKGHFDIETPHFELGCGPQTARGFILISIEKLTTETCIPWEEWVKTFLNKTPFIQAWILDKDYNFWQNEDDPDYYERRGRDYSHLPVRHNNEDPPWDRLEIDISNNPGRRLFRMGYIEAIGSTMWLGPDFWEKVGQDRKEAILAADWADVQEREHGVLRVQVAPDCFVDETTADLQNKLRETLYGDTIHQPDSDVYVSSQSDQDLPEESGFMIDPDIQQIAEAYHLDAIDLAKANFRIKLKGKEKSIKDVEKILDVLHTHLDEEPSEEMIETVCKALGSYLGEVYRAHHGGDWGLLVQGDDHIPAIHNKKYDLTFCPWLKVRERILEGPEHNVWTYYTALKDMSK